MPRLAIAGALPIGCASDSGRYLRDDGDGGYPMAMPYALRSGPCVDCDAWVEKRQDKNKVMRCLSCSIARSQECMRQMMAKEGPFYDAYREGVKKGADRYRQGMASHLRNAQRGFSEYADKL